MTSITYSSRTEFHPGYDGAPVIVQSGETFVTPELNDVASLWNAKRGDALFPAKDSFSMRELKAVLRNLAFLEILSVDKNKRYFVRYMGSELDEQLTPMTGRFTDEVLPDYFQRKWHGLWEKALEFKTPMRSIARSEFRERQYLFVEGLYAPLAHDGANVDRMMLVVYYHQLDCGHESSRVLAETLKAQFESEVAR